ncbi:unnamed protein product [Ectocarpus sp. CCAP 1310/34]|nr:unnamed protein product [Ectocarpus sp. CCAP 1310/34]
MARLAFAVTLWRLAVPTTLIRDRIFCGMSESLICEIFNLTINLGNLRTPGSSCGRFPGWHHPSTLDPMLGRRHNVTLRGVSGLLEALMQSFNDAAGVPYYIYGDPAYQVSPWLMAPYKGLLSVAEVAFNRAMSRVRATVEWGFGRVVAMWPFVDYVKKQQVTLSACGLGKQYAVAGLLSVAEVAFNRAMSRVRATVEWGFGRVVAMWPFVDYVKKQQVTLSACGLGKQYAVAGILFCLGRKRIVPWRNFLVSIVTSLFLK